MAKTEKTTSKSLPLSGLRILVWVALVVAILAFIFGRFGFKGILGNQPTLSSEIESMEKNTNENLTAPSNPDLVELGDTVVVDYVGTFENGEVFDTSIEQVAKDADLYDAARDYSQGLEFALWEGGLIPGFENAVLGMKKGETKKITIAPADAYGEEFITLPIPLEQAGEFADLKVGESVQLGEGFDAKVVEKTDETIVLEMKNPHPLAGKPLTFEITIRSFTKGK